MKLQKHQRTSLLVAKHRVLEFMRRNPKHIYKASSLASVIWPEHQMNSQGAGAAASRVLKHLEKEGKVKWESNRERRDWGWILT